MRNPRMPFQCLHALLAFFLLQSNILASTAVGVGVEAGWEYSYDPCSPLGPQHWGYLHEEWAQCANGKQQTPISIKPSNIHYRPGGSLKTNYTELPAILLIKGHEVMVNWTTSPGHLQIGDKIFYLRQCHWHSPSEHELYGRRYPLELHMVHTTSEGEIAVIGVLYEFGGVADPFLNRIWDALNELQTQNMVPLDYIHPPVISKTNYFRYNGSLTTPPCSETVIWTVMREVKSVSEPQLALLRTAVHDMDNARPIQPINRRQVYFYDGPGIGNGDHASS